MMSGRPLFRAPIRNVVPGKLAIARQAGPTPERTVIELGGLEPTHMPVGSVSTMSAMPGVGRAILGWTTPSQLLRMTVETNLSTALTNRTGSAFSTSGRLADCGPAVPRASTRGGFAGGRLVHSACN